jgi:hypothetical protein
MTTAACKQENAAFTAKPTTPLRSTWSCQALSVRESEEVFNEIAEACNDGLYPSGPSASLTMPTAGPSCYFRKRRFMLHLISHRYFLSRRSQRNRKSYLRHPTAEVAGSEGLYEAFTRFNSASYSQKTTGLGS